MSEEETQAPAEGDATLTEEQIDRFIPERIGVRNWGKPEQADLFNRGQVRDAIRTAIASQSNVRLKAAEVGAAPWSKTVESAALLLQRCTGLELQDCENLAGTILGMAANVQPKGTELTPDEIQALWSPYAGAAPFAFARKIEAAIAAKGSPTQAPCSRD